MDFDSLGLANSLTAMAAHPAFPAPGVSSDACCSDRPVATAASLSASGSPGGFPREVPGEWGSGVPAQAQDGTVSGPGLYPDGCISFLPPAIGMLSSIAPISAFSPAHPAAPADGPFLLGPAAPQETPSLPGFLPIASPDYSVPCTTNITTTTSTTTSSSSSSSSSPAPKASGGPAPVCHPAFELTNVPMDLDMNAAPHHGQPLRPSWPLPPPPVTPLPAPATTVAAAAATTETNVFFPPSFPMKTSLAPDVQLPAWNAARPLGPRTSLKRSGSHHGLLSHSSRPGRGGTSTTALSLLSLERAKTAPSRTHSCSPSSSPPSSSSFSSPSHHLYGSSPLSQLQQQQLQQQLQQHLQKQKQQQQQTKKQQQQEKPRPAPGKVPQQASTPPGSAAAAAAPAPTPPPPPPPAAGSKIFHCPICARGFDRMSNLSQHQDTHNPLRARSWACPLPWCPKDFYRKNDCLRHIVSRHIKQERLTDEHCALICARFPQLDLVTPDAPPAS